MAKTGIKIVASNRKARHDFFIDDSLEVGISLKGTEVKSIREGRINLKESYASIDDGEVFINNMHISPYKQGNIQNVDPIRKRKLLLHKRQIRKLKQDTLTKNATLVPLKAYIKNGKIKIELATARGKKLYDKRRDIAKKDAERRMRQHSSEKYD
ncbi:MAG: SsrA-binding protein SmpB [Tissierella sp.]|uniref:SsrA-binding protein SmpB n=1 Tax=Tissierella sp. TaxID=41274 RepID=UPI003F990825